MTQRFSHSQIPLIRPDPPNQHKVVVIVEWSIARPNCRAVWDQKYVVLIVDRSLYWVVLIAELYCILPMNQRSFKADFWWHVIFFIFKVEVPRWSKNWMIISNCRHSNATNKSSGTLVEMLCWIFKYVGKTYIDIRLDKSKIYQILSGEK